MVSALPFPTIQLLLLLSAENAGETVKQIFFALAGGGPASAACAATRSDMQPNATVSAKLRRDISDEPIRLFGLQVEPDMR
jgi:hypothetical protein